MINYYFPTHMGSGNRGCEAITKGTIQQLKLPADNTYILSGDYELEKRLGMEKLCHVVDKNQYTGIKSFYSEDAAPYILFLKKAKPHDVVYVTGGDLYHYDYLIKMLNTVVTYARYIKRCKVILLGCSIDEDFFYIRKNRRELKKYNEIYARESITYGYLRKYGYANIHYKEDVAFTIVPEQCNLIRNIGNNSLLGINLSVYTNQSGIMYRNTIKVIDFVIKKTDMTVVLIPHVFWKGQDDRGILRRVKMQFNYTDRVQLIRSENLSYAQIRFIISKCSFFIGARTHSIISAYSMGVPAIALGYSVKSIGIAADNDIHKQLVIDSNEINDDSILLERLKWLIIQTTKEK